MSLTKDERKSIEKSKIFNDDKIIGGIVRVYRSVNGIWDFTNIYGVICCYQMEYSLFIGIVNSDKPHEKLFEHERLYFFYLNVCSL
jgi:hypothetical protein